jgi:hypothetical protein
MMDKIIVKNSPLNDFDFRLLHIPYTNKNTNKAIKKEDIPTLTKLMSQYATVHI